jgi:hypothetical protein
MAKMIKKAQNGAKTKDSTDYFKRKAASAVFERGKTRDKNIINKSSDSKKLQDDKNAVNKINKLNESVSRQSKKGKPGYDSNGFPLKKKMQTGGSVKKSVPMSVAKKKVDSLNYDSAVRRKAGMQRTVGPKGYDDISKKLMEQSRKSDSISKNWQRGIEKAKKAKSSKSK